MHWCFSCKTALAEAEVEYEDHVSPSVYVAFPLGTQLSENVGARLYDVVGYEPLVYIATAMTALTWLLVPLVRIDRIEAKAREETTVEAAAAP